MPPNASVESSDTLRASYRFGPLWNGSGVPVSSSVFSPLSTSFQPPPAPRGSCSPATSAATPGASPLADYDLRTGGAYRAHPNDGMKAMGITGVIVDGEVIVVDPPRRLVQTWRMLMEPSLAAEGFTRLTYDVEPVRGGVTRVTVTHDVTRRALRAVQPRTSDFLTDCRTREHVSTGDTSTKSTFLDTSAATCRWNKQLRRD